MSVRTSTRLIRLGKARELTRGVELTGVIEFEHAWYKPMA